MIAYLSADCIEIEKDISILPEEISNTLNKYNLKAFSVTSKDMDIPNCDEIARKETVHYYIKLLHWSKKLIKKLIAYKFL